MSELIRIESTPDSTDQYVEYIIKCDNLNKFMKGHGVLGVNDILDHLDELKRKVSEYFETSEGFYNE